MIWFVQLGVFGLTVLGRQSPEGATEEPIDLPALTPGVAIESRLDAQDSKGGQEPARKQFKLRCDGAGQCTVIVESVAFDATVRIESLEGSVTVEDQDSGPGDGAAANFQTSAGAVYKIVVLAARQGEAGTFRLRVVAGAPSVSDPDSDLAWFEKAVTKDVSLLRRIRLLDKIGRSHIDGRRFQEAQKTLESGLVLATGDGCKSERAALHTNLIFAHIGRGKPAEGLDHAIKAVSLYEQVGDATGNLKALGMLGQAQHRLGDTQAALKTFEKELSLARQVKSPEGEALALNDLGTAVRRLGRREEALASFLSALEIHKRMQDRRRSGILLANLASLHQEMGRWQDSLCYFDEALQILEELGPKQTLANCLSSKGNLLRDLDRIPEALALFQRALSLYRELDDRNGEASAETNLGIASRQLGKIREAIEHHEWALELNDEGADPASEGIYLGNLGNAYRDLGQPEAAITLYRQALEFHRKTANRSPQGQVIGNIGEAYFEMGEPDTARKHFEEALQIAREVKNLRSEGIVLGYLGNLCLHLGKPKEALRYYQDAIQVHRRAGNRSAEANDSGNIGNILLRIGQYAEAVRAFEDALVVLRQTGNKRLEAAFLVSSAQACIDVDRPEKAREHAESAVELAREIGVRATKGEALSVLGRSLWQLGQQEKAAATWLEAVTVLRETKNLAAEGVTRASLGQHYSLIGDEAKAREQFEAALTIHRRTGNRLSEASVLAEMGGYHARAGRDREALDCDRNAHAIYAETLLEVQQGFDDAAISTFAGTAATKSDFAGYIKLLLKLALEPALERQARLEEGLTVAESLRTRALTSLMRVGEMRERFGSEGRALWDQIQALRRQVAERARTPLDNESDNEASLQGIEAHRVETADLLRRLLASEPEFAALYQSPPDARALLSRGLLQPGELLLHYNFVGSEIVVFVCSEGGKDLEAYVLDTPVGQIAALIDDLTPQLRQTANRGTLLAESELMARLSLLRQRLCRGFEHRIATANYLLVVPDGALHGLPFETLVLDGGHYLLESHGVRYAPSLSMLAEIQRRQSRAAKIEAVVYADPDFGSKSNPESAAAQARETNLERLGQARVEAERIQGFFERKIVRLGGAAREKELKNDAGLGAILHLATHGLFSDAHPGALYRSGMAWAGYNRGGDGEEDGFLSAAEVMGLDLRAVQLVVLSACESAVGKISAHEGKVSLERAYFAGGARSCVGSLWRVEEVATADLMVDFYDRLHAGDPVASALRQAKLSLIARGRSPGETTERSSTTPPNLQRSWEPVAAQVRGPRLSHPYFWAAFVASGDVGASLYPRATPFNPHREEKLTAYLPYLAAAVTLALVLGAAALTLKRRSVGS